MDIKDFQINPEQFIKELLEEMEKPGKIPDLSPANTENFVYLPITVMTDILTELKEIKAILNKKHTNEEKVREAWGKLNE